MGASNLWDRICTEENFFEAWNKVRANLGAPGLDRVSITDFELNLDQNIGLLLNTVRSGTYQPLAYLSFKMKKESGKFRELKIPAVRDRVVMEAMLLQLTPIYERIFLDCSYAYRPKKSALKAADRVERNIKKGREWVVDADIENFFDNVNRSLLMEMLAKEITEKQALSLIERCIKADNMDSDIGVPQGAAISPLLANIYLHPFDDQMSRGDWNYVRFSDNIVILCHTEQLSYEAFDKAKAFLEDPLKLKFNPDKTHILHASKGFLFLGYKFTLAGRKPGEPSLKKMKSKIQTTLQQAGDDPIRGLKRKLDDIIRGWVNYFQISQTNREQLFDQLQKEDIPDAEPASRAIFLAALALHLGKKKAAESFLTKCDAHELNDAEILYQQGILFEMLDRPADALDAYLAAFRINNDHAETAYRIGLLHLAENDHDKAIRFLQKAVQTKSEWAQAQYALAVALKAFQLHGAANRAFARAFQLDPKLKTAAPIRKKPARLRKSAQTISFSKENIDLFLSLFSGREGVYAKQWCDQSGRIGYAPVYQPLSADPVRQHLLGNETIGSYFLRADNTVAYFAIDIDISREARLKTGAGTQPDDKWLELTQLEAVSFIRVCKQLGVSCYVEDSGHKGRHLWFFLAEPIPARDAIAFAKQLITVKGQTPPGLTLEIFPKEPGVSAQALGSMVKLPLGIHKLTGRRCLFLKSDGEPFEDQWYCLQSVEKITRNQFEKAFDRIKKGSLEPDETSIDTTEVDNMIRSCNVLNYLQNKAQTEHHLTHIDRLTLLHTLGHFGEAGRYKIHKIICNTYNYSHRITERWVKRRKGSPVSCPKIRDWQSHITPSVGCYCQFPKDAKSYPTPVLHVRPDFQPPPFKRENERTDKPPRAGQPQPQQQQTDHSPQQEQPMQKKPEMSIEDIEKLVGDYTRIRKEFRTIEDQKKDLETALHALFESQKCDRIDLKIGTLRRVKEGEKVKWIIEI